MDLWVKAAHVISIIAWMAAMLYLPRLFVYHCTATPGGELDERLKVMERRLMKAIMTPAMLASWGFGLWVAALYGVWGEMWFVAKLACVIAMTAQHFACVSWLKAFAEDRNERSERFFRIMNEVPTLLMIAAVVLVIVKPF
ncbi:MAG: protoporphyrinogen oxidase HemJ [Ahrensia sp.]|nr:protoporphyrinogen oxidase HemJ [Ahrensia sp.]